MVIDTTTPNITYDTASGWYILNSNVDAKEDVNIALSAALFVTGKLETSERLYSNVSIRAGGAVTGDKGIIINGDVELLCDSLYSGADAYIRGNVTTRERNIPALSSDLMISAVGDIIARGALRVDGDVYATGDVLGSKIHVTGSVSCLYGISACEGDIEVGTFIDAGGNICAYSASEPKTKKKIICPEIRYGIIEKGVWVMGKVEEYDFVDLAHPSKEKKGGKA